MTISPRAGDQAIVVVPGTEPPRQLPGRFARVRGNLVAVVLDRVLPRSSLPRENESVVLVHSNGKGRRATPGRYVGLNDAGAWFHVSTAWRPVEERSAPRVATCVECEVVSRPFGLHERGAIADISETGARVIVDTAVAEGKAELQVAHDRGRVILPCRILAHEPAGPRVMLRLQFLDLNAPQRRAVARLVAGMDNAA